MKNLISFLVVVGLTTGCARNAMWTKADSVSDPARYADWATEQSLTGPAPEMPEASGAMGGADELPQLQRGGGQSPSAAQFQPTTTGSPDLAQMIAHWPARPRLGALLMLAQYGSPQEITTERWIWQPAGPYRRIVVMRHEHQHDFPKPHKDFLEHTIAYEVPSERAGELAAFDGSVTFDRTRGELSARCDLEAHNILALNLANDILTGKRDAEGAREEFSRIIVEDLQGTKSPYLMALQFSPPAEAAFTDSPTIAGAPVRPEGSEPSDQAISGSVGEVLGLLTAINENEIIAGSTAQKKQLAAPVWDYAQMLIRDHGQNLAQTLQLGQQINTPPLETPAVEQLRVKGAAELAQIVPLEGEQFSQAFLSAMATAHTEVLTLIDGQMLPQASEQESLQQHLTRTRAKIAAHLEHARQLQGKTAVGAPGQAVETTVGEGGHSPERPPTRRDDEERP